jgi:hypothetical protein
MSKRNLLAFLLTMVTLWPAIVSAISKQTVHTQFKGLNATADFDSLDPSGCIETFLSLTAVDGSIPAE